MGKKIVLIEDEDMFIEAWRKFLAVFFPLVSLEVIGSRAELTLLGIATLASQEDAYFVLDNRLWQDSPSGREIAELILKWGFPRERFLFSSRDSIQPNIGKISQDPDQQENQRIAFRKFLDDELQIRDLLHL